MRRLLGWKMGRSNRPPTFPLSLDAPYQVHQDGRQGDTYTLADYVAAPNADPLAMALENERWQEFAKVTGNLTLERWHQINPETQNWIRLKLAEAGLTPRGIMRPPPAMQTIVEAKAIHRVKKRNEVMRETREFLQSQERNDVRMGNHGRRPTEKARRMDRGWANATI